MKLEILDREYEYEPIGYVLKHYIITSQDSDWESIFLKDIEYFENMLNSPDLKRVLKLYLLTHDVFNDFLDKAITASKDSYIISSILDKLEVGDFGDNIIKFIQIAKYIEKGNND